MSLDKLPKLENLIPSKIVTPDAIIRDVNNKVNMVFGDIQQGIALLMSIPTKIVSEIGVTVKTIIPEP